MAIRLSTLLSLALQRVLDERLVELLADAPRRSVLMIDSGKAALDGGCAHYMYGRLVSGHETVCSLRACSHTAVLQARPSMLMILGDCSLLPCSG